MMKLLKIEWLKIIPNRALWLFIGIYLLATPGIMSYMIKFAKKLRQVSFAQLEYLSFPEVWNTVAYVGSYFHVLLGLIVIYLITREFQFKTLRQQVMDGLSRIQLLLAKISVMGVLTLVAVTSLIITALVTGLLYSEEGIPSNVYQNFSVFGKFGLQAIGNMSLAAALAFLIRKTGICFILFLFFPLLEKLASSLIWAKLDLYLPKAAFGALIPMPGRSSIESIGIDLSGLEPGLALMLSIGYVIVFLGICSISLEKSNL